MFQHKHLLSLCTCSLLFMACTAPSPSTVPTTVTPSTTQSPIPTPMLHTTSIESEREFLELMILHHQEAVDRSVEIQDRTSSPKLVQFSQNVAASQNKEIETMQRFLDRWYANDSSPSATYVPMMEDNSSLSGPAAERAYIVGMLAHHREAIAMAKQVKLKHPRAEVIKLADEILLIQGKEVELLTSWLQEYSANSGEDNADQMTH